MGWGVGAVGGAFPLAAQHHTCTDSRAYHRCTKHIRMKFCFALPFFTLRLRGRRFVCKQGRCNLATACWLGAPSTAAIRSVGLSVAAPSISEALALGERRNKGTPGMLRVNGCQRQRVTQAEQAAAYSMPMTTRRHRRTAVPGTFATLASGSGEDEPSAGAVLHPVFCT